MKYELQSENFKKINNLEGDPFKLKYTFQTKVSEIQKYSSLLDWMDTNPREQNLQTNVSKKIIESLNNEFTNSFHNLNRGILFSANSVRYNNQTKVASFEFIDGDVHGNIDGGHTLKIILENVNNENINNDIAKEKYVTIEVFENLSKDEVTSLAEARNTSMEVKLKSLLELQNKFDCIKNIIDNKIKEKVSFKENEKGFSLEIREIISMMNIFNLEIHDFNKNSTSPYNSVESELKKYLRFWESFNDESGDEQKKWFEDRKHIFSKVFELYDLIEKDINSLIKSEGRIYKTLKFAQRRDKNGELKPSSFQSNETKIFGNKINYIVPKGLAYPILSSFREFLSKDGLEWIIDPIDAWKNDKKLGAKLAIKTLEELRNNHNSNPQSLGKSEGSWENIRMITVIYKLQN